MPLTFHDKEKFIACYHNYADAIFRHCYFRVNANHMRAEDATQEVFLKTWKYLADGHSIENVRSFLYQVANNTLANEYKKKKEYSLDELQEHGFEIEDRHDETILEGIDRRRAFALVETLDPDQRETVIMRFVEDLPLKEIAEIRGESANAVSLRIRRALEKLRNIMRKRELMAF